MVNWQMEALKYFLTTTYAVVEKQHSSYKVLVSDFSPQQWEILKTQQEYVFAIGCVLPIFNHFLFNALRYCVL